MGLLYLYLYCVMTSSPRTGGNIKHDPSPTASVTSGVILQHDYKMLITKPSTTCLSCVTVDIQVDIRSCSYRVNARDNEKVDSGFLGLCFIKNCASLKNKTLKLNYTQNVLVIKFYVRCMAGIRYMPIPFGYSYFFLWSPGGKIAQINLHRNVW